MTASKAYVRADTLRVWGHLTADHRLHASLGPWDSDVAPDGLPMLSARITGPHASDALCLFGAHAPQVMPHNTTVPAMDVDQADRTGLVWLLDGVWVALWHPYPAPAAVSLIRPPWWCARTLLTRLKEPTPV